MKIDNKELRRRINNCRKCNQDYTFCSGCLYNQNCKMDNKYQDYKYIRRLDNE
jgi:hypothetical protein